MDLISTASDIKKGVKKLEWITKLAEALEEIGSIEQATRETQKKKIEADEALVSVAMAVSEQEAELKAIKAKAKAAKQKSDKEIEEQKEAAKAVLEDCTAQIEAAKEQAITIIEQANSQASKTLRHAEQETIMKEKELAAVEAKIDEAVETLESVQKEIADTKAKAKALFNTFG